MNKAFVREPDASADRCPRCASPGLPVSSAILDAYVALGARDQLGEAGAFCPSESCAIAYFDAFDRSVSVEQLARPVYPKDPLAPICACFGFTAAEIEEDVREGTAARTRALIERARSAEARCSQLAANGQSCVPNVQRCFMRRRGAG